MDQEAHEARLLKEMTIAREVWRKDEPVATIGQNQSENDFRDQRDTAAWAEANFLVSGKANDPAAVRIASELATEGRGMTAKDAVQLAEAITVVHGSRLAKEEPRNPGITYEGLDSSDQEERWKRSLHMPGQKVRFDSEPRVSGIDPHETISAVGLEPLTVSKAIVRGEERENFYGGKNQVAILEYEFEGKEGRHNAAQFMEEGGRERTYGVILERDGRMWLTPIHEEADQDVVQGVHPNGPAIEIVGFAGKDRDLLDPNGFPGMLDEVREENGISGEFHYQPRDGYRAPGPINLLSSPWSSGVGHEERAIAEKAIDTAIAKETREREDPIGVLVESMAGASTALRRERPVSETPIPHDRALHEAKIEMMVLMRGRDPKDGNVRMAAAMVATGDRPVEGRRDLDATELADSMAPSNNRRGILAQATGLSANRKPLDVAKPLSKGSEIDGDGASLASVAMRRGSER